MLKKEKIFGKRIYLRCLTLDDVSDEYCQWFNNPEITRYLMTKSASINDLKQYIKEQTADPDGFLFGIFDKENDAHIGNVRLLSIDRQKKTIGFGIVIGNQRYWGKGIGTEVLETAVDFAFNQLGLDEIEARCRVANTRAIRTFEKAGFRNMGINERYVGPDGIARDVVVMIAKRPGSTNKLLTENV